MELHKKIDINPTSKLDKTSDFLPYMEIIHEGIRQNKVSVDELIAVVSYREFMKLGYALKSELYDVLMLPSTKNKNSIKKFTKSFDTITREEFETRKSNLAPGYRPFQEVKTLESVTDQKKEKKIEEENRINKERAANKFAIAKSEKELTRLKKVQTQMNILVENLALVIAQKTNNTGEIFNLNPQIMTIKNLEPLEKSLQELKIFSMNSEELSKFIEESSVAELNETAQKILSIKELIQQQVDSVSKELQVLLEAKKSYESIFHKIKEGTKEIGKDFAEGGRGIGEDFVALVEKIKSRIGAELEKREDRSYEKQKNLLAMDIAHAQNMEEKLLATSDADPALVAKLHNIIISSTKNSKDTKAIRNELKNQMEVIANMYPGLFPKEKEVKTVRKEIAALTKKIHAMLDHNQKYIDQDMKENLEYAISLSQVLEDDDGYVHKNWKVMASKLKETYEDALSIIANKKQQEKNSKKAERAATAEKALEEKKEKENSRLKKTPSKKANKKDKIQELRNLKNDLAGISNQLGAVAENLVAGINAKKKENEEKKEAGAENS